MPKFRLSLVLPLLLLFFITNNATAQNTFTITSDVTELCTARESVVWTNSVYSSIYGNDMYAITGGWNCNGRSLQEITSDGYVEYVVDQVGPTRIVGLSNPSTPHDFSGIQFAFYTAGSNLYLWEGRVIVYAGSVEQNQVLRVAVKNGVVKYSVNESNVYTSTITPVFPLVVNASVESAGVGLKNVIIHRSPVTFTADISNAINFKWFVNNESEAETNTGTFTASLIPNDKVRCEASLPGSNDVYVSNEILITSKSVPATSVTISPPAVSSCQHSERVIWKDLINCRYVKNGISSLGNNWISGASSLQEINGEGSLEYTLKFEDISKKIGLSTSKNTSDLTLLQYSFYVDGFYLYVGEGYYNWYICPRPVGKKLKITVKNGVVRYYVEEQLVFVSSNLVYAPLKADVSVGRLNYDFRDVYISRASVSPVNANFISSTSVIGQVQWYLNNSSLLKGNTTNNINVSAGDALQAVLLPDNKCLASSASNTVMVGSKNVLELAPTEVSLNATEETVCTEPKEIHWDPSTAIGCSVTNGTLIKTLYHDSWNGGGSSVEQISGYGYMEYVIDELGKFKMIGLSNPNTDPHYSSVKYAFFIDAAYLAIYENGNDLIYNANFYADIKIGDKIKILATPTQVIYYLNNEIVYINWNAPVFPLVVDAAVYSFNSSFSGVKIQTSHVPSLNFSASASENMSGMYQWFLNDISLPISGASASISDLAIGDKVKVVFTPDNVCFAPSEKEITIQKCEESIVVTRAADDNLKGSFRYAINKANENPDLSTITFNIPADKGNIIEITSELPALTAPVIIDGTTQTTFNNTIIKVTDNELSKIGKGLLFNGNSKGSVVKGLSFGSFDNYGLWVQVEDVELSDVDVE